MAEMMRRWENLTISGIGVGHRWAREGLVAAVNRTGLKPVIDARYPLAALPDSLDHLDRGGFGKIVVEFARGDADELRKRITVIRRRRNPMSKPFTAIVPPSFDSDKRSEKSMTTAIETVKAFCVQFSKSKLGMHEAIRAYFTPKTVWENVGLAVTTGIDEALGVLAQFNQAMGIDAIDIEMLAIAADGNRVLTERIDHLLRADGSEVWAPA